MRTSKSGQRRNIECVVVIDDLTKMRAALGKTCVGTKRANGIGGPYRFCERRETRISDH